MKTKWVIHKLNSYTPSWTTTTSLFSPYKIRKTHQNPSSKASTFVLNHLDISLLLSICGREGLLRLGCSLHASVIKTSEFLSLRRETNFADAIVVWNSILSMYTKCRVRGDAVKVFEDVPVKDTVTWNTMISGFLRIGEVEEGFGYLKRMRESGFCGLDQATLTTVLSACDMPETSFVNRVIHCLVFVSGFEREITVGNALITSYFRCGCCSSGRQVFDEMHDRNVVSWTAIISGLAQSELYVDSLRFFMMMTCGNVEPNALTYSSALMACSGLPSLGGGRQIHGLVWKLGIQSDLCIESALMDVYSKCGSMEDALRIFESARELDEVSLTVILVGFAQNGYEEEAVQIFLKMLKAGVEIDPNMVSAVLGVFGVDTSLGLGQQIHSLVIKRDFGSNAFVGNGLINMYSKCGNLQDSIKVFSQMPLRNSVSWNSMIAAFARHGNGRRALQLYEEMRLEGAEPTDVTFLSLLHACSHVGLVEKGMEFLKLMTDVHGISPRMEHYACVVDMLGRAGHLDEAKSFIEGLSVDPDMLVWQALLGACGMHEDAEMGKYAAEQLVLLSPEKPAPYVLLANIYSSKGRWKERAKIIKKMKETGVTKETGISWIEIENKIHSFVARDKMHPQAEIINEVLEDLFILMIDEGYDPEKGFILYSSDQEE